MTPLAIRAWVTAWLQQQSRPIEQIGWKWLIGTARVDYAAPLQSAVLTEAQQAQFLEDLSAELGGSAAASFDAGFLNLRFESTVWAGWMRSWEADPAAFLHECKIPADMADITIYWKYRMLKTFREAAAMVSLGGWDSIAMDAYAPQAQEIDLLKTLLGLGSVLQQRRDVQQKRLGMMEQLQSMVEQLWQSPILVPLDPGGSAWRQSLLRLALMLAEAIGAPSKQSLQASLQIQN